MRAPLLSVLAASFLSVLIGPRRAHAVDSGPPPASAGSPADEPAASPAPGDSVPAPAPSPADDIKIEMPPPPPAEPPPPPTAPAAPAAPPSKPPVTAKLAAEIYGFVELDSIYDTTQALNETPGNTILSKDGSFAATHDRLTYTGRNSRIGLRLKGPESELLKTSAILEMDFLGNQPTPLSEASFFTNPTFRFRHMALKIETPGIDVVMGQTWQLFGWQSYFHPNTVEIQGVPGEVYSRALQVRLGHSFKSTHVTLDLAASAARPPQRDGARPDLQGGVRLLFNRWKALHTSGSTGTAADPGGFGISGDFRQLRVNELSSSPATTNSRKAGGVSIDALIPIIPGTLEDRADALTLTGSFVQGTGIADLYTGLTGGIGFPALPNPTMASPAPTYTPNIDAGLVTYSATGDLHSIDWRSFIVGAQYYLPPSGHVWISANFSQLTSKNIALYTPASMTGSVFKKSQWADGNLFVELNSAVRLGGEVAWFSQRFVDESVRHNYRFQLSGFYIF